MGQQLSGPFRGQSKSGDTCLAGGGPSVFSVCTLTLLTQTLPCVPEDTEGQGSSDLLHFQPGFG